MTDFLSSMPAAYFSTFSAEAAREHAAVVARRGARPVHAELCPAAGVRNLCVVADDRPGLLALITDALLAQGLGIRSAYAYCRKRAGARDEAIDFLELALPQPSFDFDASELGLFVQTLTDLIEEDTGRPSAPPQKEAARTRVYFDPEALLRGEHVLLVEAPDSKGLLHAISSALHAQSLRIVSGQIRTEAGVARDRFDVESIEPRSFSAAELCDVQLAVLDALAPRR